MGWDSTVPWACYFFKHPRPPSVGISAVEFTQPMLRKIHSVCWLSSNSYLLSSKMAADQFHHTSPGLFWSLEGCQRYTVCCCLWWRQQPDVFPSLLTCPRLSALPPYATSDASEVSRAASCSHCTGLHDGVARCLWNPIRRHMPAFSKAGFHGGKSR